MMSVTPSPKQFRNQLPILFDLNYSWMIITQSFFANGHSSGHANSLQYVHWRTPFFEYRLKGCLPNHFSILDYRYVYLALFMIIASRGVYITIPRLNISFRSVFDSQTGASDGQTRVSVVGEQTIICLCSEYRLWYKRFCKSARCTLRS